MSLPKKTREILNETLDKALSTLSKMEAGVAKIRDELLTSEDMEAFQFTLNDLMEWPPVHSEKDLQNLASAVLNAVYVLPSLRQEFLSDVEPTFVRKTRAILSADDAFDEEDDWQSEEDYEEPQLLDNRIRTKIKALANALLPEQKEQKQTANEEQNQ